MFQFDLAGALNPAGKSPVDQIIARAEATSPCLPRARLRSEHTRLLGVGQETTCWLLPLAVLLGARYLGLQVPARSKSSARALHASEVVPIPEQRGLTAVVVADTHSQPHPKARPLIERLAPDLIFHAGDIGDLSVLDQLRKLAPLIAVRGNVDERAAGLADTVDVEFFAGERSVLKLLLTHIAVYGPKLRAEVARLANAHAARIVLCGHSHVPFLGRDKGIVVFNPGSIGPRRFQLPITLGVLQVSTSGISLRHVSCETGETWLP